MIGIAISVGFILLQANEIESNRMAVIEDLQILANKARQFYLKPISLGGGASNYTNASMRKIGGISNDDNGSYYIEQTYQNKIVFMGVGNVISDDDSIRVRMIVTQYQDSVDIIN